MAAPFLQTSFTAGEISPALWGQIDLRKYQTGAAVARNMWVDYRGGQFSRPGTSLAAVGLPLATEDPPCLIPFVFNQEQAYVLELSDSVARGKVMRIFYRGEPVRYTGLALTAVAANITGATFTFAGSTAAGWAVGQRIYIDGVTGGLIKANGLSGVNKQTFIIASSPGANQWKFTDINGVSVTALGWTAWSAGGTGAREVWVTHPWDGDDLFDLKYAQSADVLTVTHNEYDTYTINRLSQTSWTITAESFGSDLVQPASQAVTALGNDPADPQYFYAYVVTAYNTTTREESAPGAAFVSTVNRALDQTQAVANSLTWTAVSGADMYRIYKAQPVPNGYQGSAPYFWGLLGQAASTSFVDNNLEADYAISPPGNRNPFIGGAITGALIAVPGFGYITPIVQITDPAGRDGDVTAPNLLADGGLDAPLVIVDGGQDYQAPVATVVENRATFTPGTGATFAFSDAWVVAPAGPTYWIPAPGSITVAVGGAGYHVPRVSYSYAGGGITSWESDGLFYGTTTADVVTGIVGLTDGVALSVLAPAGGTMTFTLVDTAADVFPYSLGVIELDITEEYLNKPACVAFYQQRRVFAATQARPSAFWMSRPGQFSNFDVSYPSQSDDAIQATVVAGEVNQILSLTPMNTGVIALTAGGAFLISGDGKQAPVTPATVNARTQTFSGASSLQPLRVSDNLVYVTAQKTAVRDLQYDFFTDIYKGTDLSVLCGHLFSGRDIVQWAWASEPWKLAHAVRDDGILLSMCYLKEQEVVGWTRSDTNGQFVSVCSIPEPNESAVYVVVRRYIFGTGYRYFTERFSNRDFGQNTAMNIPSDPERVWCVDAGARHPLTYPTGTLTSFGFTLGALTDPVVVDGGVGVPAGVFVQVVDDGGTGSGGVVSVTVSGGTITAATLVSEGSGYTNPRVVIGDGSYQAVISISFHDLGYFQTSGTAFSGGDVGKVLRVGGGRGVVTAYLAGPALLEVSMTQRIGGRLPNEPAFVLPPSPTGTWSLTAPVTIVGGLEHLNGCDVQIVADGSVVPPQTVVDGAVTLPSPATAITVGQGFSAQFQTLRPADPAMQGRRRSVSSVTLRAIDTRGVAIGNDFTDLVEMKDRTDENYGQPIEFQIGGGSLEQGIEGAPLGQNPVGYDDKYANLSGGWDTQGHICILQRYPMPLHILAYVSEITLGDTPG